MPEYRRPYAPGGTFFFTVVTQARRPILGSAFSRAILRDAILLTQNERPFELLATVLLNDHLHAIWELPHGDSDFSSRWGAIKGRFTRAYLSKGGNESNLSDNRLRHGERGVWQPRFYDHLIRDDEDLHRHLDYVHYNPVKHGYSKCPHQYPYSSFAKWVRRDAYGVDWCCNCNDRHVVIPSFEWADGRDME